MTPFFQEQATLRLLIQTIKRNRLALSNDQIIWGINPFLFLFEDWEIIGNPIVEGVFLIC